MSKTKVLALSILIALVLTPYAYARTESFALAPAIVKSFDKETKTLLPKGLDKEQKSLFTKTGKENRKETLSRIKSLRRSEGPSSSRFSRLFRIIDRHIQNNINEVDKLAAAVNESEKGAVEDMSVKLQDLRKELLADLKATSYSERKSSKRYKPDPVLDRSPYEERPGDTRGLYDR